MKELGIDTVPTEMTFGISRDEGKFEWSGTNLNSIFAQRRNLFNPKFWRMIFDIVRFNQFALDLLSDPDKASDGSCYELSIGEYLEREGYSQVFRDDYLIPMTACVWSTGADKCALEFPATTLVRFMWNHHLLSTVAKRPDWLTIPGGSKRYIDALLKDYIVPENVHLSKAVRSVEKKTTGTTVAVTFEDGWEHHFDEVILACHGDQAMSIVASSATKLEKSILGSFHTTPNDVYLHSDISVRPPSLPFPTPSFSLTQSQLLPRRRIAWSAWNYLTTSSPPSTNTQNSPSGSLQKVALTYNMNILQHIPTSKFSDVLVTMNPPHPPSPELTQAKISYRHPLYNAAAVSAQDRLQEIQGTRGIWYCGAWTNYGFHEDGFSSGIAVGRQLGGSVPWDVVDAKFMRGRKPELGLVDYVVRMYLVVFQFFIGWFVWWITLPSRSRDAVVGRIKKMV